MHMHLNMLSANNNPLFGGKKSIIKVTVQDERKIALFKLISLFGEQNFSEL